MRRYDINRGMADGTTTVAGIDIPSVDPVFLAMVAIHILLGLACVIVGALAMLSRKRRGRHSRFGTVYFWCLVALFGFSTVLAIMRWAEDYDLLVLGVLSFASAWVGRIAVRRGWPGRFRLHLAGMGLSYIMLLAAFYVDNGKQLPIWKDLPPFTYWLLPFAVGTPIIIWALFRHPVVIRDSEGFR